MLRIRVERRRRGWSQTVLAFHAGSSAPDISKIENGVLRPYPRQARALANALAIPVESLLDDIPETDGGGVEPVRRARCVDVVATKRGRAVVGRDDDAREPSRDGHRRAGRDANRSTATR